jgi:ubiquinone/menaquinone biosynthesis C-methylase UbiE
MTAPPTGHGHGNGHGHGGSFRSARRYDASLALALAGRGRALRRRLTDLLEVGPGHRVLDVGCGTGTLALAVARVVAPSGSLTGIDTSPQMIARATAKAARRRLPAQFQVADASALPFDDDSFDAAVSSLVLHHLPEAARAGAVQELLRVVRPGGRVVLADMQAARGPHDSALRALAELLTAAGAHDVHLAPTPVAWIGVAHATAPSQATTDGPTPQPYPPHPRKDRLE